MHLLPLANMYYVHTEYCPSASGGSANHTVMHPRNLTAVFCSSTATLTTVLITRCTTGRGCWTSRPPFTWALTISFPVKRLPRNACSYHQSISYPCFSFPVLIPLLHLHLDCLALTQKRQPVILFIV